MGYYAALEDPVPWYSRLTQDLPQLARNWLMKYYDNALHGSQYKKGIPVDSNMQLLAYQWHFFTREKSANMTSRLLKPNQMPRL